jgi:hypothetical protein
MTDVQSVLARPLGWTEERPRVGRAVDVTRELPMDSAIRTLGVEVRQC